MASAAPGLRQAPGAPEGGRRVVRRFGVVLFPLILAEGILGIVTAGSGSSGATPLLAVHVAFGLGLVALASWAVAVAFRASDRSGRIVAAFTAVALAATAATGAVFLATGSTQGALVDRALALASLGGAVSMIVFGGGPRAATTTV